MNKIRTSGFDEQNACFNCGSTEVERAWQQQEFQYGSGESAVELTAEMPVYTCKSCGFQFAGPEADDARHEAVCRHIGVLTPQEIISIRESAQLSRNEFCDLTRIGIASLKRWETGALIQNAANDELVYLMSFTDNAERMRARRRNQPLERRTSAEEAAEHVRIPRRLQVFRGRCMQPSSTQIAQSRNWPLRARA